MGRNSRQKDQLTALNRQKYNNIRPILTMSFGDFGERVFHGRGGTKINL